MRYLIDWACIILAVLGVIVIFGAVGNDDLMMEMGVNYPFRLTMIKILIGTAMIIPEGVRTWLTKD